MVSGVWLAPWEIVVAILALALAFVRPARIKKKKKNRKKKRIRRRLDRTPDAAAAQRGRRTAITGSWSPPRSSLTRDSAHTQPGPTSTWSMRTPIRLVRFVNPKPHPASEWQSRNPLQ